MSDEALPLVEERRHKKAQEVEVQILNKLVLTFKQPVGGIKITFRERSARKLKRMLKNTKPEMYRKISVIPKTCVRPGLLRNRMDV